MRRQNYQDNTDSGAGMLLSLPVAVDFIRFEKNLLQIGFFGAHDTRHKSQSTRRIEQIVNRDGQKIRVSAEFRASQEMGLPSTSDRDKYIAFMRIAMEQKTKHGEISNPIRFTGYRLLKELGLSYSGENYEDINRWGQRLADTTITSEQVIYLAARKKYANKTVHVFRSFTRAGQSNLDDTGKADSYEVVLEDWLLENLNQSYVVPEDFNAYRKLKRPTAKGIFGYLHLWFHASHGRQIEKDYSELCLLLNIPVYKHVSKIRDTMGRSLNELVDVGYLSTWDVRPMSTKNGYKLVLSPGQELLDVLAVSQRKQVTGETNSESQNGQREKAALEALTAVGISPSRASALCRQFDPETIIDQIEHAEFVISKDRRGAFENPAGFVIYAIEQKLPLPAGFVTSRQRRDLLDREQRSNEQIEEQCRLLSEYQQWKECSVNDEFSRRFEAHVLAVKVKDSIAKRARTDDRFKRMAPRHQEGLIVQLLKRDLEDEMTFPSFEDWSQKRGQRALFEAEK